MTSFNSELSPFGDFVRRCRDDRRITMRAMATALGVSLPMASMVETGKKKVPESWPHRVSDFLNLTEDERGELSQAVDASNKAHEARRIGRCPPDPEGR